PADLPGADRSRQDGEVRGQESTGPDLTILLHHVVPILRAGRRPGRRRAAWTGDPDGAASLEGDPKPPRLDRDRGRNRGQGMAFHHPARCEIPGEQISREQGPVCTALTADERGLDAVEPPAEHVA